MANEPHDSKEPLDSKELPKDAPIVFKRGADGEMHVDEGAYQAELLPGGGLKIDPKNVIPKSGGERVGEPYGPDVISSGTLTTDGRDTVTNN